MKKILIANWKMNGDSIFIKNFLKSLEKIDFDKINSITCIICPPFPYIKDISMRNSEKKIFSVGAQNFTNSKINSCTSGVSISMLKDIGCTYVILGHSETRKFFNEDYCDVVEKAFQATQNNIIPIVCFEKFENIENFKKLKEIQNLILAYEPIKSIGTGNTASIDEIQKETNNARNLLNAKCIYGGSVNKNNAREILEICDGALIGKASLDTVSFCDIISKIA